MPPDCVLRLVEKDTPTTRVCAHCGQWLVVDPRITRDTPFLCEGRVPQGQQGRQARPPVGQAGEPRILLRPRTRRAPPIMAPDASQAQCAEIRRAEDHGPAASLASAESVRAKTSSATGVSLSHELLNHSRPTTSEFLVANGPCPIRTTSTRSRLDVGNSRHRLPLSGDPLRHSFASYGSPLRGNLASSFSRQQGTRGDAYSASGRIRCPTLLRRSPVSTISATVTAPIPGVLHNLAHPATRHPDGQILCLCGTRDYAYDPSTGTPIARIYYFAGP